MTGDAELNEACDLASVADIELRVDAGVTEVRGLTAPGAYGETGLSCTWYLDSGGIGIPSVTVQWAYPVTVWHQSVVDLYRQFIEQGLATELPDIGEAAMAQGSAVEAIDRDRIVRVTVLMHPEPTEADVERAIGLLVEMLEKTLELRPPPGD